MNIAKALKEKTRLVSQINQIDCLIKHENSMEEGVQRSCNIEDKIVERMELMSKLVDIKTRIAIANAGIASKLHLMSELKSLVSFYQSLNTRAGTFGREDYREIYTAIISKADVLAKIDELQNDINNLQDEIDDFNAATLI